MGLYGCFDGVSLRREQEESFMGRRAVGDKAMGNIVGVGVNVVFSCDWHLFKRESKRFESH